MYTILLSLAVAAFITLVPMIFGISVTWTILPGFIAGILAFVWINRRISKRITAVTGAADAELATLQQIAQRPNANTAAAINQKFDRAIELLKQGFIFQKWQIGIGTMLNARVGMLYYTRWMMQQQLPKRKKNNVGLAEAIPYLEKSRVHGKKAQLLKALWPAWAMLGVAHYRGKSDLDAAIAVFEDTVQVAKKEGLLWSLYAWVLWKEKRLDAAVDVLARGHEAAPDDPRLAENLSALQNRKGMKMRGYGEQWYQFGLEAPKMANAKPRMGHPRMRGRGGRQR